MTMEYEELRDLLEGLYAYDTGSYDSGIRDETRRAEAVAQIEADPDGGRVLGRIMRDLYLTDLALAAGHTWEDAYDFGDWLAYAMKGRLA